MQGYCLNSAKFAGIFQEFPGIPGIEVLQKYFRIYLHDIAHVKLI